MLKIKAFYKLWANHVKKNDDGYDPYKVGLVNNGMFFMTAIIGVICKIYYRHNLINQIMTSVMTEQKMEVVAQHDIDHHIFCVGLEKKEKFFALFEYAYTKFYRPGYEFLKTFKEKYNNYSNFTKLITTTLPMFLNRLNSNFVMGFLPMTWSFLETFFIKRPMKISCGTKDF